MAWEKFKASTEVYGTGQMASENLQNSQKKLNKSCNLSVQTAEENLVTIQFIKIRKLMFASAPKVPVIQMWQN